MNNQTVIEVLPPTWHSLFIETFFQETRLGTGTGFVIEHNQSFYLITNRHIVTGRDNITGQSLSTDQAIPDRIRVFFNGSPIGNWTPRVIELYADFSDDSTFLWNEHPIFRGQVDVIVIKLNADPEINFTPYSLNQDLTPLVFPSDNLSVVGFPFGRQAAGFLAIWSTGFLATDMTIDFDNLPCFLIDCRSRPGQSGSPVIAQRNGGFTINERGQAQIHSGMITRLLGIYSGRINDQSDLGFVWKLNLIREIIESI